MSAVPGAQALVDAGVRIVRSLGARELALHALHTGAEGVAARATLRLRTLEVATRRLVVGAATKLTQPPHGVLVLGLELELALAACHDLERNARKFLRLSQLGKDGITCFFWKPNNSCQ